MYYLPRLSDEQLARLNTVAKERVWEVAPRFASLLSQHLEQEQSRRAASEPTESRLPEFENRLWSNLDVGEALQATEVLCTVLEDQQLAEFADKLHKFVLELAISRLKRTFPGGPHAHDQEEG